MWAAVRERNQLLLSEGKMDSEEKVKEGERKRGGLMVEKLRRGILVGKREGNSTPSPTWKFGLIQPDGTLVQEFNFSTYSNTLSARKLGANLWEMQPQLNLRVAKMGKNGPTLSHHKEGEIFGPPKKLDEAPDEGPSEQPTSGINLRKQVAVSPTQHNLRAKKVGQAQQPLSPASYSSSMEMASQQPATSPSSSFVSNGKFGESSQSLKTSTELLKVLNRIWSLEEKHALDMSLVKTLKRELEQSEARIQELLQEKKRDEREIDSLMKQLTEYKVTRKKEHDRIKDAVKLVENKLEDELKLRRHSEKLHHKLAKELSEIKSSLSNALRELERERKARILLEDLCDEFAKGIIDYEQEVRSVKQKFREDQIGREGNIDRLILHISEAWLDERTQTKLAEARDNSDKDSALDKLCLEIEAFLREKQPGKSEKNVSTPSKISFHLNEPASAPWNVNDEDDSINIGNQCSLNQGKGSVRQKGELKETVKTKLVKKKPKGSDPSTSQMQLQEEPMENLYETKNPRMPKKGETVQKSSREGKNRITDADEGDPLRHENVEGSFDPSTFAGLTSPVKKWTSEASAPDPDVYESSMRWPTSMKSNSLKAKLMEARLEGQQARSRSSKGLSHVD